MELSLAFDVAIGLIEYLVAENLSYSASASSLTSRSLEASNDNALALLGEQGV